ncbi:ABC transporter ATP-binding protein [Paracoccus laeviglucosivorans]|uniref:Iron complex transport system ATP-binding protein n=1 Tax=Paracoccus laeviglucosivorans TaxID=1197861 RepID=A0A521BBN8_9RHOB|nr:ATP-binding cassette domain-containing protein [Paracoccus laeviglucosivorans]SMO44411.1 iron complex transport system ATP-binding protein [Paracoccus laeviglucosivorans]
MTDPLFTIKGLCVDVPGRRLIHDLDLELPGGQVIALIGHNGSSKSTLLKVLARQIVHSSGGVSFAGRPITDYSPQDYARGLAFMPQTTPPAEGMTVRELVALGRYPWHGALGRFGPDDHVAVDSAMSECGVTEFADQLVDTLSGGERQRCWLAMMVAQQAGTLLLDEPISALDIAHQVEVLSLVRRMCHDQGRTAIVVLHEVNMAARFCDHVVAMKAGRLAMQGSSDELMRPEALEHVYGLPMQVLRREDGGKVAVPA